MGSQQCRSYEAGWPNGEAGSQQSHGTAKGRFPSLRFGTKTAGEERISARWYCYIGWEGKKGKKREKIAFMAEGREAWKLSKAEIVRSQGSVRRRKRKLCENSGLSGGSEWLVNCRYKRNSRSLERSMKCMTVRRQDGFLYTKAVLLNHSLACLISHTFDTS